MKKPKLTPQQIDTQARIHKTHASYERAFKRLRNACTKMTEARRTLIRLNRKMRELATTPQSLSA